VKRLILARHAKSAKDDPRLRDIDRPLNTRGEKDAPEMGGRLARRGIWPQAVLSSPARRALETARLIARELDFPWKTLVLEKRIYGADVETLLEVVRSLEGRIETALLVGHNPGLTDLARALGRSFHEDLPTCAVVGLDIPTDTWHGLRCGTANVLFYDYPKNRA
jgi:phosphohistidine phosphatase